MQSNRSHAYYRFSLGLGLKWTPLKKIEGSPQSFSNKQHREQDFQWSWCVSGILQMEVRGIPVPSMAGSSSCSTWIESSMGIGFGEISQNPWCPHWDSWAEGKSISLISHLISSEQELTGLLETQKLGRERDDLTQCGILDPTVCGLQTHRI